MIKYLYIFLTAVIGINVVEGIPLLDVFSRSWHAVASWILTVTAVASMFGTVMVLVGYLEEHENLTSDFAEFFLRTAIGQTFLPKWPVIAWLAFAALLLQFNQVSTAICVLGLSVLAGSVVFVHNGFYTSFLKSSAQGN